MSLTFTSLTTAEGGLRELRPVGQTGRHPQAGLDRPGGAWFHRVLAGWPGPSDLPEMEWTHVLLEAWPIRPLALARRHPRWPRHTRRIPRLAPPQPRLGPPFERQRRLRRVPRGDAAQARRGAARVDRKSTRLNSSHVRISYAVF